MSEDTTLTFGNSSSSVNETINANGASVTIGNSMINLVEIRNDSTSHTNPISFSNYNTISLSNEKKIVWNGAEVAWIYDAKSIYAILIKDIKYKFCCPENDFNYNYYDHNDNGGEGFGILIGDAHHSLIEVC